MEVFACLGVGRWRMSDRLDLSHCCVLFCLFVFVCVGLLRGGVGFCVQGVFHGCTHCKWFDVFATVFPLSDSSVSRNTGKHP